MKRRSVRIVLVVAAGLAPTGALAAHLGFSGASGGSESEDCSVANVLGDYGDQWGWTTVSGDDWCEDRGAIGAYWGGAQATIATASYDDLPDERVHLYTLDDTGVPENRFIRVETRVENKQSGACSQLNPNDPSWWWVPSFVFTQSEPVVERWSGSSWVNVELSSTFGSAEQASGGDWDSVGDFVSSAPTGGPGYKNPGDGTAASNHGHFRGLAAIQGSFAQGTEFRVRFPWTASAAGDVDNASVAAWQEYCRVWCFSHAQSSEDSFSVYAPFSGDKTGDFPPED